MADVKLQGVVKRFGEITVIPNVDLEIRDGSFTVLVGPSGCGKSTLLRLIAGLETASGGLISIDGSDVTNAEPSDRGIAMVFQSYALYPHMSVASNIGFSLKLARVPKPEIARRVADAASVLRLESLLHRKPRELSGGQRQRVAIGRAIVRNPKVFLFDEPLSNLDAALRTQMRVELAELHRRIGATMIYVTHDQVEAMTMADRIVVMNGGRIEQAGAPMELYDRPATEFVATFIGSPNMNMIGGEAATRFDAEKLGIRPEHLGIVDDAADWTGRVKHVENLGSDTIAYVEVPDVGTLITRTIGSAPIAPESIVGIRMDRDRMHRFRNGQRI